MNESEKLVPVLSPRMPPPPSLHSYTVQRTGPSYIPDAAQITASNLNLKLTHLTLGINPEAVWLTDYPGGILNFNMVIL